VSGIAFPFGKAVFLSNRKRQKLMSVHYKKIVQASMLVALSGILYGFLGYLGTRVMQENTSIAMMLFWRFFIAGIWMFLFVLKSHLKKKTFAIDPQILIFTFFLGALGYAGSSGFYFIASHYIGTGLAMVIFFSYPIIIALSSWIIHRKKLTMQTIFILAMMVAGLFLLQNSFNHAFNLIGVFWGIIAALCYAFYVMGSKRFSSISVDSTVLTMMVSFGCALIFLLLCISEKTFFFPHSLKSWIHLLLLGILATALPIQLMLEGLKYISSMRASIISVLEPLVTVFIGIFLLNESVSYLQILGGMLILGSALLVQFQREL
jgi:drug/metabolite transporter (DMT)-like permease